MFLINYLTNMLQRTFAKLSAFISQMFIRIHIPSITVEQNVYFTCLFGDYNALATCLNGQYQPQIIYPAYLSNYFLSFFPRLEHYYYKKKRIEYINFILLQNIDNNLFAALQSNNPNIINLLSNKLTYHNMITCLKNALKDNKPDVAVFLRIKVLSINIHKALEIATSEQDPVLIEFLINKIDANIIYQYLIQAIETNDIYAINLLITKINQDMVDAALKFLIQHEHYNFIDIFANLASSACIARIIREAIVTKNKVVINALMSKIPENFTSELFEIFSRMQENEFNNFVTNISGLLIYKSFCSMQNGSDVIKDIIKKMPYFVAAILLSIAIKHNNVELIELLEDRVEAIVFSMAIKKASDENSSEPILMLADRVSHAILSTKAKERVLYFFSSLTSVAYDHAESDLHDQNLFIYEAVKNIRFFIISCILLEDAIKNSKLSIIHLILPRMDYLSEQYYDKHEYIPKILLLALEYKNLDIVINFSRYLLGTVAIDRAYSLSLELNLSNFTEAILPYVSDTVALGALKKAAAIGDVAVVRILLCRKFSLNEFEKIVDVALHNNRLDVIEVLIGLDDLSLYFYQVISEGFTTNEKFNAIILSWKNHTPWKTHAPKAMLNILITACGYNRSEHNFPRIEHVLENFTIQYNLIEKKASEYRRLYCVSINQRISGCFFVSIEPKCPKTLVEHASYFYKSLFYKTVGELVYNYQQLLMESGLNMFKHKRAYVENYLNPEQREKNNKITMQIKILEEAYVSDVGAFEVMRIVRVMHLRNAIKLFMEEEFDAVNADVKDLREKLSENLATILEVYWGDELREAFALLKLHVSDIYGELYTMSADKLLTGFIECNIKDRVCGAIAKAYKKKLTDQYRYQ